MKRILSDTRCVIIASVLTFAAIGARANNEWTEFYNNTRMLGMGGVGVAITSDDTSLFRNPANLGSLRDVYGAILNPEIEGTGSLTASSVDLATVMSTMATKPDVYYRQKSQITPVIVRRNIGFGLFSRAEVSAEVKSTAPGLMDTVYKNDVGAILGTNLRLFDGRIKIGVSGRAINRIEVVNPTLSVSGTTDLGVIGASGDAVALDGGLLIQAPWAMIPTLGVVVRDIGDTKFKTASTRLMTASAPATVKQSIDAAIALFPIHSNLFRSVWTLEYSDVTNSRNDTDNAKRIHFGIEWNSRDIFFFRLGYNQRYLTAGFEVASEYITWQLATYGEEIGTAAAPREDRRLNTTLAVRF